MNEATLLITLNKWHDTITEYCNVSIDFDESDDQVSKKMSRRQHLIDTLQVLDADFEKIRVLKREGWKNLSVSSIKFIEEIIESGNLKLKENQKLDSQTLENAKKNRSKVSSKLNNLRLSKRYLPSNLVVSRRPSVIVDNQF